MVRFRGVGEWVLGLDRVGVYIFYFLEFKGGFLVGDREVNVWLGYAVV